MKKIKDFQGRESTWNLNNCEQVTGEEAREKRSKYHVEARALLYELFSSYSILEEVAVPNQRLYLDFFLPGLDLAVEVNGRQHTEYVPFFHKSPADFNKGQLRDRRKARWCELNDIDLITLDYSESADEWRERLQHR